MKTDQIQREQDSNDAWYWQDLELDITLENPIVESWVNGTGLDTVKFCTALK